MLRYPVRFPLFSTVAGEAAAGDLKGPLQGRWYEALCTRNFDLDAWWQWYLRHLSFFACFMLSAQLASRWGSGHDGFYAD